MSEIVSFMVLGHPAPWSVYTRRGKPSLSFQNMQSWQAQIQAAAKVAWAGRPLLAGPVKLDVVFYDAKAHRHDRTNLLKAFEDAIQGIIFKNDVQVTEGTTRKEYRSDGYTVAWVEEVPDAN